MSVGRHAAVNLSVGAGMLARMATHLQHVSDAQRRARLALRHGIAPQHRYPTLLDAARAMTVLHATEAYSVHLALGARVESTTPHEVEEELFVRRGLVKQLAMRRTLFAFPTDLLPAAWGSAAARTASNELRALKKAALASGITDDPDAWWEHVHAVALHRVSQAGNVASADAAALDPALQGRLVVGSGRWTSEVPLAPRVLLVLGAQGLLVRTGNTAHWRLARPTWGVTAEVLPDAGGPTSAHDGYVALLRRWLWTFGPGTETDMVWWLGATRTIVRAALATLEAVPVSLDSGDVGWLLPDDLADVPEPAAWAALLPVLDPTTMGWKQRDFYLAPEDVRHLFDSNGNAGTTAWVDGRIVGCWVQDEEARVRVVLRPDRAADISADAVAALDAEARRLTEFLDGTVISSVYSSRQMKGERLP